MIVCNTQDLTNALPCCKKDKKVKGFNWKGEEGLKREETIGRRGKWTSGALTVGNMINSRLTFLHFIFRWSHVRAWYHNSPANSIGRNQNDFRVALPHLQCSNPNNKHFLKIALYYNFKYKEF